MDKKSAWKKQKDAVKTHFSTQLMKLTKAIVSLTFLASTNVEEKRKMIPVGKDQTEILDIYLNCVVGRPIACLVTADFLLLE